MRHRIARATYPDAARATPMRPYLVLLRVGFAVPPSVATGAVRSYRTVSPLPAARCEARDLGGLLSVALSVGSRRPGVTWHSALWSPDFPRRLAATRLSGRLRDADSTGTPLNTRSGARAKRRRRQRSVRL